MKPLLYYFLQLICISALLYGYYHLALRNKKFHRYNRFYLLSATILSIIIPFLNIPLYFTQAEKDSSFVLQTLSVISLTGGEEQFVTENIQASQTSWFTFQHVCYLIYTIIALIVFIRILFSLLKIKRIIRNNPVEKVDSINFVTTEESGTPFSFFRWLFWNKKIDLRSEKGEQIFKHEIFHIEQKHSWDIMYMELLTVFCWFNPFFHLMKKEMKAIHEFLADQFAVKENKHWEYAELLLMQALNTHHHLVNPFFHNQIKRRIAMITTSQKPRYQYLRKMLVLPIAAAAVALFAFSYKNKQEAEAANPLDKPITVIIDAGHGGEDAGAHGLDGTLEKDITLAIAQKIKMLNEDKNIHIILTRDEDNLPTLHSRTDLASDKNADLFISIHVNSAPQQTSKDNTGVEVFISRKNQNFETENKILAGIFLNHFAQLINTTMEVKQRQTGIWVLDNSPCPAAIIECGYLSNKKDLAFITDDNNQNEIAKTILKGITQYFVEKKSNDWEERKNNVAGTEILMKETILSKPASKTTYAIRNSAGSGPIIIQSDSIVFKKKSGEKTTDFTDPIFIINGIQQPSSLYDGKMILSKRVTIYDKNDKNAVSLYGKDAVNGVVVFEKATVTPNHSNKITQLTLSETKNKPLLVIDNEVKEHTQISEIEKWIKPYDIEAINVLRDSSAIVKYGKAGEFGVIEITTKKADTIPGNNIVFDRVEVAPSFPGGDVAWRRYLERNVDASVATKSKAPHGIYTVIVQFIVDKEGNISDVKTLTKHGYGMEEEAIRAIKLGPKWIPATQNGHIVKAYRKQPISFQILSTKNDPNELAEVTVTAYQIKETKTASAEDEIIPLQLKGVQNEKKNETEHEFELAPKTNELVVTGYPYRTEPDIEKAKEEVQQFATVYPNPADQIANISLSSTKNESGVIRVIDMNGKIVLTKNIRITSGSNQYTLHTGGLRNGNYILQVVNRDQQAIKNLKLVIK